MPEYVDETLALAATLSNEQLGAFVRLRAHAWKQDPPCTLLDDDDELAILSGLGERWLTAGKMVKRLFQPIEGGRLVLPAGLTRYAEVRRRVGRPAIPRAVRRAVLERDGPRCRFCGLVDRPELDHVVPVSHGGDNSAENLQVLCNPCNRGKGPRPYERRRLALA